jgi:hypothetical protein
MTIQQTIDKLMKQLGTPSGMARTISRILRERGYQWSNTSIRYYWTEGYHVHRVGYSSTMSVDYHIPSGYQRDKEREARWQKIAEIRVLPIMCTRPYNAGTI